MGILETFFGSKDEVKTIPADQLMLKRSPAQSAYASYFYLPEVMGIDVKFSPGGSYSVEPNWQKLGRMKQAKEEFLNAFDNYGQRLQNRLVDYENFNPIISTPFGNLPAFGLQKARLQNEGLLAGLMKEALISPKQAQFDVLYQQPLNMFLQQDLARYGVRGQPVVEQGSGGFLGPALGMGLGYFTGGLGYALGSNLKF